MINKAIVVGHLGHAPRIVETGKTPFAAFSVATTERWRDKDGERHESTDWHDVVAWGERWVTVAKMMRKGSKVYVEGQMKKRKYTGKDGVERTVCEVVLSGFRGNVQLLDRAPSDRAPDPEDPYGGSGGGGQTEPQGGDFDGYEGFER
jgi:single-strand DNA-binding protein